MNLPTRLSCHARRYSEKRRIEAKICGLQFRRNSPYNWMRAAQPGRASPAKVNVGFELSARSNLSPNDLEPSLRSVATSSGNKATLYQGESRLFKIAKRHSGRPQPALGAGNEESCLRPLNAFLRYRVHLAQPGD